MKESLTQSIVAADERGDLVWERTGRYLEYSSFRSCVRDPQGAAVAVLALTTGEPEDPDPLLALGVEEDETKPSVLQVIPVAESRIERDEATVLLRGPWVDLMHQRLLQDREGLVGDRVAKMCHAVIDALVPQP